MNIEGKLRKYRLAALKTNLRIFFFFFLLESLITIIWDSMIHPFFLIRCQKYQTVKLAQAARLNSEKSESSLTAKFKIMYHLFDR